MSHAARSPPAIAPWGVGGLPACGLYHSFYPQTCLINSCNQSIVSRMFLMAGDCLEPLD